MTSPEAAAGKSLENSSWVAGWLSTSGGIPTVILSDQTNILMLTGEKYRPFGSIGGLYEQELPCLPVPCGQEHGYDSEPGLAAGAEHFDECVCRLQN